MSLNPRKAAVILVIASSLCVLSTPARAELLKPGRPPKLTDEQKALLMRTARRTVRDAALGRDRYEPSYVPDDLAKIEAEAVVRLRLGGYLLSHASGGPAPLPIAVRDAAHANVEQILAVEQLDPNLLPNILIEIEVVGPPLEIHPPEDWTQPRALDPFVEPGIDGLVIVAPNLRNRFCPTELFTNDLVVSEAVANIAKKATANPKDLKQARLFRFRTTHWYQHKPTDPIQSLRRGMKLVSPDAITPEGLDRAIETLSKYLRYRQKKRSGVFSYQYEASKNRFSDEDNLVRQVGAAVALAMHAHIAGDRDSQLVANTAIDYHLQGLRPIPQTAPGVPEAAYIATADEKNKLGVTALLALAMAEHPNPERYAAERAKLIRGMLSLQQDSGMFLTAFPPSVGTKSQEYFPGEALLAISRDYDLRPTTEALEAFDRALPFYRDYFRARPSPAFVPWQAQAFARMARTAKRADYAAFVYEMCDWLSASQLTPENCEFPDMWGGIAGYQKGRAGVATASYTEGIADALALAKLRGDAEHAKRYAVVVKAACRFIMQLQVRPEEAYFVRSPQDAIGGIRTTPTLNLLRIDHCQHALVALLKARDALYGPAE